MRAAVAEWPSWLTATWAFRTQFSLLLQILKCVCVCMCFKLPFCKMGTVSSPRQSCRGHHRQRPAPHTRGAVGGIIPDGEHWAPCSFPGRPGGRLHEHSCAQVMVLGSHTMGRGPYKEDRGSKVASHSSTGPTTGPAQTHGG